jgi:hypothetical protein
MPPGHKDLEQVDVTQLVLSHEVIEGGGLNQVVVSSQLQVQGALLTGAVAREARDVTGIARGNIHGEPEGVAVEGGHSQLHRSRNNAALTARSKPTFKA